MIILVIVAIAIIVALWMVLGALAIGTAGAWFLHLDFLTGWHAAWDKPWVLAGWSLIFIIFASGVFAGNETRNRIS